MIYYRYKIFGLSFESDIEITGLFNDNEHPPDIWIRYGYVPETLKNAKRSGTIFESFENDFLFKLNSIARCRVQNGKLITIHPLEEFQIENIRSLLIGPIFSGLFFQRGLISIHGSAVAKKNKSVVFSGASQVGKSSLAYALSKKGYSLIADDLALIDCSNKERLLLHPGVPFVKLWKDILNHFHMNDNLLNIRTDIEKYIKPVGHPVNLDPVELKRIVFLRQKKNPGFTFKEISGFEKYNMLINNSFRFHYLDDLTQIQNHFINLSRIANDSKIYVIERPESPLQIMELANFVIEKVLES